MDGGQKTEVSEAVPGKEQQDLVTRSKQMAISCQNGIDDRPLFDAKLLQEIDFSNRCGSYKPEITPQRPGENLILRPLCLADYDKGFLHLLEQLTVVGEISREKFEERFNSMEACKSYYIIVIEDTERGLVIGSATLAVEQKFIRQCACKGRIEDIVVSNEYRGKQLGKLLLDVVILLSIRVGCYKVSLECKDQVVQFYEQFRLVKEEGQNYMCRRF